jgi:2',3'-cyclic-nucleotide 2'-phosphodiesterase (5'-nucleotidase family)
VIKVKGQQLLEALKNGVSKYPALDGRFPQVSNISFTFDPSRSSHDRIVGVQVSDKPLDVNREYSLATRGFMVKGGGMHLSTLCIIGHHTDAMQMAIPAFVHDQREDRPCPS